MNASPVIPAQSQLRSHISATNDARVYRDVSTRSTKGWKIDHVAAPRQAIEQPATEQMKKIPKCVEI